jgi:cytoskeletal protein CcmA (bactofilin family)
MIFKSLRRKKSNGNGQRPPAGPSIISSDVVIEGNVTTAGELQIDGAVHGIVRAHSCVIDMQGVVQGEIIAEEVFVRGRVIGPIRGLHVHLHAGAHVEGDVINETIAVENGAYIYGNIRRSDDPLAEPASSRPTYAPAQQSYDYGRAPALPDFGPASNASGLDQDFRPIRAVKPR